LAVDGRCLTLVRFCCGRVAECAVGCALRVGLQMQAVTQSLLEVPNGVDYGIDRAVLFVTRWWDEQRKLADSGEFLKQRFGVEQPWVWKLIGAKMVGVHFDRLRGFLGGGQNL
jgi:hypothetical protein